MMKTKTTSCLLLLSYLIVCASTAVAQFDPFGDAPPRAVPAAETPNPFGAKKSKTKNEEEPVVTVPRLAAAPVDPKYIRLHLSDGSLIAGELSVDTITVQTEFGDLQVPVEKIRSFTPGLDSNPELVAKIEKLFEELGSDNYQSREAAKKALIGYGLKIQHELARYKGDDNAERKRHLEEIRKALSELEEEQQDDFDNTVVARPWIRGDSIVTPDFTIVGQIAQKQFTITSKYGPLNVKLADVSSADRPSTVQPEVRKSLTVMGANLVQRSFKSSGIRIEKGDKITVRADGQVVMTPWGSNTFSTPDGGANFGVYSQGIMGGALVAKIGSNGKVFKVGSRSMTIAKQSGVLQFAVAMQAQYANQNYNYPGQYNLRIKVQPK